MGRRKSKLTDRVGRGARKPSAAREATRATSRAVKAGYVAKQAPRRATRTDFVRVLRVPRVLHFAVLDGRGTADIAFTDCVRDLKSRPRRLPATKARARLQDAPLVCNTSEVRDANSRSGARVVLQQCVCTCRGPRTNICECVHTYRV